MHPPKLEPLPRADPVKLDQHKATSGKDGEQCRYPNDGGGRADSTIQKMEG